ncbi:hypothetical protein BDN70DRAFT_38796 [Pholiota conissans]|uniref:Uncharacterized protein n=1 Tax=Pholiota conissans TaxID=109636 RepID=A0A9P5YZE4_9AGAR|nr:hypothetical protein BDN70DRAFT_38796 [Pholiota conissans]
MRRASPPNASGPAMFHTLQVLAAHPELNNITALQLSHAFSLISCLKRDITIPQPLSEAPECPPTFLPPAIAKFLAESLSISLYLIKNLWEIVREKAWVESQKDEPGKDDEECFCQFGRKRELSTIHGLIIDCCHICLGHRGWTRVRRQSFPKHNAVFAFARRSGRGTVVVGQCREDPPVMPMG